MIYRPGLNHLMHAGQEYFCFGKSFMDMYPPDRDTLNVEKTTVVTIAYSALSPVFSTNVVCVKTQQKHARIKHHDRTKQ